MRQAGAIGPIWALAIVAPTSIAHSKVNTLYSPSAASVGSPMSPIEAIAVIREPIDRQHGSGRPCPSNGAITPISSYTITGRQLVIRCPNGSVYEFPFTQASISVGQQPCSWLQAPCTWSTEPYLFVSVGNRMFSLFFNKNDVEWAKRVANAFWSIGQSRSGIDPANDSNFQSRVQTARSSGDRSEAWRRTLVQGQTLVDANRLADAANLYAAELEKSVDWPEGHYNLALVYGSLEFYPEAIVEMKRFLYLAPSASDAREAQDQIYAWEALLSR